MAWLKVIGVDESGLSGLKPEVLALVINADFVVSHDRGLAELKQLEGFAGEAHPWPTPFLDIIDTLKARQGSDTVILATGDPLWYGVGAVLLRHFSIDEMEIIPAVSGFQLAAGRMGWPLHETLCLTVHARPHEAIVSHLAPSAKMLILAHDCHSAGVIAALISDAGYGSAEITALGHIGGADEVRHHARADEWAQAELMPPDFHIIAIACPDMVAAFLPRVPGLPDDAFISDGKLTKSELRATTLARLAPQPSGVLWDLGCGSGSVGIEWMRACPEAKSVGIDMSKARLEVAGGNAIRLGVPSWRGIYGALPAAIDEILADLPSDYHQADAVFIGGGLSMDLIDKIMPHLKAQGRLVINTVTLESEMILLNLWRIHGGALTRIGVSRADKIGQFHGWRPLMPVSQWSWIKPHADAIKGGD